MRSTIIACTTLFSFLPASPVTAVTIHPSPSPVEVTVPSSLVFPNFGAGTAPISYLGTNKGGDDDGIVALRQGVGAAAAVALSSLSALSNYALDNASFPSLIHHFVTTREELAPKGKIPVPDADWDTAVTIMDGAAVPVGPATVAAEDDYDDDDDTDHDDDDDDNDDAASKSKSKDSPGDLRASVGISGYGSFAAEARGTGG